MMIRKMQLDDLPQVAAIEQSLFGDAWSEKAFRDTLEQEEADFIVAVNAQNEIIGYCGAYRALDEAEIVNVAIKKDHQNHGYGAEMVQALIGEEKSPADGAAEHGVLADRQCMHAAAELHSALIAAVDRDGAVIAQGLGTEESGAFLNFDAEESGELAALYAQQGDAALHRQAFRIIAGCRLNGIAFSGGIDCRLDADERIGVVQAAVRVTRSFERFLCGECVDCGPHDLLPGVNDDNCFID